MATKKLPTQARQNKLEKAAIAIDPITVTFVNDKGKHEVASRQKKKAKQNTTAIADQVKTNAKKEGEKLAKELADRSAKHDQEKQEKVIKYDPAILPSNDLGIVKIANKDPDPVSVKTDDRGKIKILDQSRVSFSSLSDLFSDDLTTVIKKKSSVSLPQFRKIRTVRTYGVINVLTGSAIDTVFIDKLGYRVPSNENDRGYIRFSRKDKDQMLAYLCQKHKIVKTDPVTKIKTVINPELFLKEDHNVRYRYNKFTIDQVCFTAIDRPYNGDPTIQRYFILWESETKFIGKFESLDLAKQACFSDPNPKQIKLNGSYYKNQRHNSLMIIESQV